MFGSAPPLEVPAKPSTISRTAIPVQMAMMFLLGLRDAVAEVGDEITRPSFSSQCQALGNGGKRNGLERHARRRGSYAVSVAVPDVQRPAGVDAEPAERRFEERGLRLRRAGLSGRDDRVEEVVDPDLRELLLETDVPVGDAGEREARRPQAFDGGHGALQGREDHGADE